MYEFLLEDMLADGSSGKKALKNANYVQTAAGVWLPQRGSEDGAAHVQLTGRKVEEIIFFDSLAINDTTNHRANKDLSKYKSISVMAFSTLDKNVELLLAAIRPASLSAHNIPSVWDGNQWNDTDQRRITITNTNRVYFLNTKLTWLKEQPLRDLQITATCSEAPTTGSLTVVALGVTN